jgi:hypothetical protein
MKKASSVGFTLSSISPWPLKVKQFPEVHSRLYYSHLYRMTPLSLASRPITACRHPAQVKNPCLASVRLLPAVILLKRNASKCFIISTNSCNFDGYCKQVSNASSVVWCNQLETVAISEPHETIIPSQS